MARRLSKSKILTRNLKTFYKKAFKSCLKFSKKTKKKLKKVDYFPALGRLAFASLIFTVYFSGPSFIGITTSYYNDEETSENILKAGVVDIVLENGNLETLENSLNFGSGKSLTKNIKVLGGPQSSPFIYNATTTNMTGDLAFCQEISLDVDLNASTTWQTGNLETFSSATTTLYATSTGDIWNINFKLPSVSSTPNSVCSFDFIYNAYQNSDPVEGGGFTDTEIASTTIYSWGLRINKVYYDVASDRGTEPENEWVEIYNQTDGDINLEDWQICDNHSCDTLPDKNIKAKGFAVITPEESTWNYWQKDDGVVSIVLGNDIGNGLANTSDMLALKRPDGMIVDQMNWGTPSVDWNNYNENLWNPGALDVPEGSTLGRKPNGYDTNRPTDFVKLSPPILDLIYPDQSGTLTWYWTYTYTIEWNAENPNGDDNNILIDLFYIQDTDGNSNLSSGDTEFVIGKRLSNTGTYDWKVPSGFLGYIWVKIVGFGPENPMLNTKITSGKIYDPYPTQILVTELEGLKPEGSPEELNPDGSPEELNPDGSSENSEEVSGALTPITPEEEVVDEQVEEISEENVVEENTETTEVVEEVIEEEVPLEVVEVSENQEEVVESNSDEQAKEEENQSEEIIEQIEGLKPNGSPEELNPDGSPEELKPEGSPDELKLEGSPENSGENNSEKPQEEIVIIEEPEEAVLPEPEPVVDNPSVEE